jgi:hypothetical protein
MNSNRYMPGYFDININACDLVKQISNPTSILKLYIDNYDKFWVERYKSIIHPCPYVVS